MTPIETAAMYPNREALSAFAKTGVATPAALVEARDLHETVSDLLYSPATPDSAKLEYLHDELALTNLIAKLTLDLATSN